jgi:DNA-directed RNA polymerase subunit M/transcription elongation factor TFIIS
VKKLTCQKCGGLIFVRGAKPGDVVLCRRCLSNVTVPGSEKVEEGKAPGSELTCDQCGAVVDAAGRNPGETAPCPACGAVLTMPDYAEAETSPRRRGFVPCPVCGSDELRVVFFWGLRGEVSWLLDRDIVVTPVKCLKCGAKFDGPTGDSIEPELFYARTV